MDSSGNEPSPLGGTCVGLPAGSNLADLGREADDRDAAAIVDILAAARPHRAAILPGFVRRMVDDVWQTKRLYALPGGHAYGHRIYRRALPWSSEAVRRSQDEERLGRGLILEHVIPVGLTLAQVQVAETAAEVISVLRRDLILAVITKEQSRELDLLGFGRSHPDPADPWLRYRLAGFSMFSSYPSD